MHPFQHIVSGDYAAAGLKTALALADDDVVNMADDLAVGPLADVDAKQPIIRAAFWRRVYGPQAEQAEAERGAFSDGLANVSNAFRRLPENPHPCLVWFGTGATEQLTLRRACHFLTTSSREIWGVEILPKDQKPLPPHWCTGVGVLNPEELARVFARRRMLMPLERARLADEWTACISEGDEDTLRHPIPGGIQTRAISAYDDRILVAASPAWQQTARVCGNAMGHSEDALISDQFIFWRIREMATAGILELDPFEAGMRESKVRRIA